MEVVGGDKDGNVTRAVDRIGTAANEGAQVVLLPECLDLGWTHPSCRSEAEPIPEGRPYQRIAAAAAENGVYVCAGLTEYQDDRVFNSAVFVDSTGGLRAVHRKINELDIAHRLYAQGDRLQVVQTEWGVFGVMICADAFASGQVISRSLGYMGADIIVSPSSWAVRDPG
jgi:predicted amidohydrolase